MTAVFTMAPAFRPVFTGHDPSGHAIDSGTEDRPEDKQDDTDKTGDEGRIARIHHLPLTQLSFTTPFLHFISMTIVPGSP